MGQNTIVNKYFTYFKLDVIMDNYFIYFEHNLILQRSLPMCMSGCIVVYNGLRAMKREEIMDKRWTSLE